MAYTPTITLSGASEWRNDRGDLHRGDDLPAVILYDGKQQWWKHGAQYINPSHYLTLE